MATVYPKPEHTYEIRVDQIEVTQGGWFGPPSPYREFIAGQRHYFVDGVEVDQQTYTERVAGATTGMMTYSAK